MVILIIRILKVFQNDLFGLGYFYFMYNLCLILPLVLISVIILIASKYLEVDLNFKIIILKFLKINFSLYGLILFIWGLQKIIINT